MVPQQTDSVERKKECRKVKMGSNELGMSRLKRINTLQACLVSRGKSDNGGSHPLLPPWLPNCLLLSFSLLCPFSLLPSLSSLIQHLNDHL